MNTKDQFEELCRSSSAVPIHREEHRNGVIFIADGPDLTGDHTFRTIWAFARGEEALMGFFPLHFDRFSNLGNGVLVPTTKEMRLDATLKIALDHVERRNGRQH